VRRVAGRADLLRKTVKVFLGESARLVPAIRQAIEQGDAPKLRLLAHSLKGSADCFAADAAVAAAFRLEMMGRDGDLAEAREAFTAVQTEIEQLRLALAAYG
jgi:HPt (histidine-containing phosphotransfer) domain-containing protein